MFSRSIHTVTRVKFSSFLWSSNIPLCKYPIVVSSTHLLLDTWAAFMSWWLQITLQWTQGSLCSFELVVWVPLDIFPEVGSLGQKADPFLIFWDIFILLSTVAAPVCIPTNSAKGFPFLHILDSTCLLTIDDSHSDRCEMVSHCGFDLHFSDD